MRVGRPTWFWIIIVVIIFGWILAGTRAVLYILEGEVFLGEGIIISATILLTLVYYGLEWWINK